MSETVPLYIGGKNCLSSTGATYEVHSSATGKLVHVAASASADDCNEAVQVAAKAFETWKDVAPAAKETIFLKAAALITSPEYRAQIIKTVKSEISVPDTWGHFTNTDYSGRFFTKAARSVYHTKGEILQSDSGANVFVYKRPMGVVFIISPWNAPLGLSIMTSLPALIAGNTVVLKTSEYSPASQLIIGPLLKEAGLPDGVLNVIHTSREDSPARVAQIIAHPLIRKIGFTGSDRVGRIIAGEAAKYLKPCVFELGGKAPSIVLNDADVETAARALVSGAMVFGGQLCISTERVIVQREVAPKLLEKIKEIASTIKRGDRFGPLFSEASASNVVSMIQEAVKDGAEVLLGNQQHEGAFVDPHVVLGTKPGSRLWDRESFGPVMTVAIFDTIDEAVELANASSYSLTSSLWTSDVRKALDISPRIRSGKVLVNSPTFNSEISFEQAGLGGSSGYGSFSVEEFLNTQMVHISSGKPQVFPLLDF